VDSPFKRDEEFLEKLLAEAIQGVVAGVRRGETPSREAAVGVTRNFTWESVFDRIETSYHRALDGA
jgi:hypothetical protein